MPRRVLPIDVGRLRPLAEGLAHRIARQPADVDDLVQVGLLAYIVDYRRLLKGVSTRRGRLCTERDAWALAKTVLRRAMLGHYGAWAERMSARTPSLDDIGAVLVRYAASDSHQRQSDLLELHDYLDALEHKCGRTARLVAQNLIEPVGDCAVRLTIEVRRKQAAQRGGYSPSQPRVRFSQRAVRVALALDRRAWTAALAQVRGFTRAWISKNV